MTTPPPGQMPGQIPTGNPYTPQPGSPSTPPQHPAQGYTAPHPGYPDSTYGYQTPQPDQQTPMANPAFAAYAGTPLGCRFCQAQPAVDMTFRAHQGLLLMMRFQKVDGLMCRACGEAVYREMQGKTLWQGWWSPFSLFLLTPFTLLWNLFARWKTEKLAPPPPNHPTLDPGRPVHRRALSYVALVPIGWILYLIATDFSR